MSGDYGVPSSNSKDEDDGGERLACSFDEEIGDRGPKAQDEGVRALHALDQVEEVGGSIASRLFDSLAYKPLPVVATTEWLLAASFG